MQPSRIDAVVKIASQTIVLRGQRVLIDSELAALYGVSTARLNQQVRRNRKRFPTDFPFLGLTAEEFSNLKLHFATSSWGGRRKLPLAFTEHSRPASEAQSGLLALLALVSRAVRGQRNA